MNSLKVWGHTSRIGIVSAGARNVPNLESLRNRVKECTRNEKAKEVIMVKKVDHIGIAVKNLDEALNFYENVLGLKSAGTETVEEQKVKVAFLPLGDTEVELLESTEEDGPLQDILQKMVKVFCI